MERNFDNDTQAGASVLRQFLYEVREHDAPGLDAATQRAAIAAWRGVDCLACGNCCKSMSPVYTQEDIQRIATHLRMSPRRFKAKWLYQDKQGRWMNKQRPCQFLDMTTNKCAVYAVRPMDCAGFPHLALTPAIAYLDMHRQNLAFCPATFNLVEGLYEALG